MLFEESKDTELVNVSFVGHRGFVSDIPGIKDVKQIYDIIIRSPLLLSLCPSNDSFMEQFQHVCR